MGRSRHLRRGVYLLPTLFTVGNLFCGYASVVQAFKGDLANAALLIIAAAILDGLDGRLARLTNTTSDFGVQFDSLADMVSFGVAPAMLAFQWGLGPLDRIGWLVAFLYVVCVGMRLARFNIQTAREDKRYFAGLPSPPAAGTLACVVFAVPVLDPELRPWIPVVVALLVAGLAALMLSRLRYRSFKEVDLRNRRSYIYVLLVAAMLVAIVISPKVSMLLFSGLFVLSAPAAYLTGVLRRVGAQTSTDGARPDAEEVADERAAH